MRRQLSSLALTLVVAAAAGAEEISFDDVPPVNSNAPPLAEEYAHLGAHFSATDDGSVWSGVSGGDPGGWGLEGTNGTNFVGFNGQSYGLNVAFDHPVREVKVDVARSLGSRVGDGFVLRGYRDGAMVEEVSLVLGDVNAWTTVELAEEVDAVSWVGVGVGTRRHPFGVDNLRWTAEAALLAVEIDVRPGNRHNPVNPLGQNVVPVALFGAENFDVTQVDRTTLGFGPGLAPVVRSSLRDVDRDGVLDLVSWHRVPETGIAFGDTEACLTGQTLDGTALAGCDAVATVPLGWLLGHGAPGASQGAANASHGVPRR